MTTPRAWTDDEIAEEIKRCIEEGRCFEQYVYERLPGLLSEHQGSSKNAGKSPAPKNEPTPDDGKKSQKRKGAYWGSVDEDKDGER